MNRRLSVLAFKMKIRYLNVENPMNKRHKPSRLEVDDYFLPEMYYALEMFE